MHPGAQRYLGNSKANLVICCLARVWSDGGGFCIMIFSLYSVLGVSESLFLFGRKFTGFYKVSLFNILVSTTRLEGSIL
jgi:hypothetical protein